VSSETADVQVLGAGFAGRLVARALREVGATVRLVDPYEGRAGHLNASAAAAGIVLPCPPEHFHRLEAAIGTEGGAELCDFLARGARELPGFDPCGVRWRVGGPEVAEVERSVEAARRMRVRLERTDDGFHLLDGGAVDLVALHQALEGPVESTPGPSEFNVIAAGWRSAEDPYLADKLLPARWQAARYATKPLPWPVVSQHANLLFARDAAGIVGFGARWATPHLEVGETEPVCEPRVSALLDMFAQRMFPGLSEPTARWAGIIAESCDQLPLVGPIPGRPRSLAFTGFGLFGLASMAGAARALALGLSTGRDAGLPARLRTMRFL
jgi:glycine/D-amino acid oxidase-like deaminating enzyme